jgi:hypothetical protein
MFGRNRCSRGLPVRVVFPFFFIKKLLFNVLLCFTGFRSAPAEGGNQNDPFQLGAECEDLPSSPGLLAEGHPAVR